MTDLHRRLGALLGPEEDEAPPPRRSQRDWIVDCVLFLLAIALGAVVLASGIRHGLDGPLLVVDVVGGATLCVALWWRRRRPFALGIASLPVLAVSSSAGPAGVIILFTVAAFRRWQQAVLVVGLLAESRAAGMRVHADVRLPAHAAVPDAIGRHALRIVQEALTNARKHATSAPVELQVAGAPGEGLAIDVRNPASVPAVGEPEIPGTGTGLVGLSERATLTGGHLAHGLDERGNFHVRAWLPWPE